MKKMSIIMTAVVACALLFVSWKKVSTATAALHIELGFCYVLDGDGTLVEGYGNNVVVTSSGNGNWSCKAKKLDNHTGRAVHWNINNAPSPYLCGVDIGLDGDILYTDDWQNVVSASGNVTLQCKLHP